MAYPHPLGTINTGVAPATVHLPIPLRASPNQRAAIVSMGDNTEDVFLYVEGFEDPVAVFPANTPYEIPPYFLAQFPRLISSASGVSITLALAILE